LDSEVKRQGMLMVLSSPSGAGKSTLSKLLRQNLDLKVSISATTRAPRGVEKNGKDYFFLSTKEFEEKIAEGAFIEWAKVHGNYYGTFKSIVLDSMKKGYDLLFDIDYNGMFQLRKQLPECVVSVFILPPSMDNLRNRLSARCEDSNEDIEKRIANAYHEIKQYVNYDYILINNTVEETYEKLKSIYLGETCKKSRAFGLDIFINKLLCESIN